MAEETGRPHDVVLSYCDSLLRRSDVELLKEPHWLNDAVIGFYFEYLKEKFKKENKNGLLFIGPELTQLLKMTHPSHYSTFLGNIGISTNNFIFFPLNNCTSKDKPGGSHWSLLVFCRKEKTCYHFDSCKGSNIDIALEFTQNIMLYSYGKPVVEHSFIESVCPQQDDGFACGDYVLCFTDIIADHVLENDKLDGCDFNHVKRLVQTKRSRLLNLINELQNE